MNAVKKHMLKNKTIKLFLILGVIIFSTILVSCNSSTPNGSYNDFFVEIYDGKIIVGDGNIERFFQLTNEDKQQAKIEIKETILLNEEKCDEEYYLEHKDEYPKISYSALVTPERMPLIAKPIEHLSKHITTGEKPITFSRVVLFHFTIGDPLCGVE